MKLISIQKSPNPTKKYRARFLKDGRIIHTDFGSKGMMDFIEYSKQDPELAKARKSLYLTRHRKREHWEDPTSAGSLSRHILWNYDTFDKSLEAFKNRFHL
jgi:hypothetical protein